MSAASFADTANTLLVPSRVLGDAAIHYEWQNWRFAVNVANIADKIYVATVRPRAPASTAIAAASPAASPTNGDGPRNAGEAELKARTVRLWSLVHKWTSLISTVFLLLLCVTGLPLIFHHEIDEALGLCPKLEMPAAGASQSQPSTGSAAPRSRMIPARCCNISPGTRTRPDIVTAFTNTAWTALPSGGGDGVRCPFGRSRSARSGSGRC